MNKIFVSLFFLLMLKTVVADSLSDSKIIIDWLEENYSDFFPNDQRYQSWDALEYNGQTFWAQHYLPIDTYIGTSDGVVYVYSTKTFAGLVDVGSVSAILSKIKSADTSIDYLTKNTRNILNDTGINTCSNEDTNGLSCPQTDYPGQDADYGSNSLFSFTTIKRNGDTCVQDNVSGLLWEVKTDDGGFRDKDNTYTWYNSTAINDGGDVGLSNGGSCNDSGNCDTEKYVLQVNKQGLCGYNDWRLPTIKELEQLVDFSHPELTINSSYFPNTISSAYWSASSFAYPIHSWVVYFNFGNTYFNHKNFDLYVRLVRSGE